MLIFLIFVVNFLAFSIKFLYLCTQLVHTDIQT